MNIYEEVNILVERLTEAWGVVAIACDGKRCVVANANALTAGTGLLFTYEAPTLLEALRLAADAELVQS